MATDSIQSKWKPRTRLGWWAVWLMVAFVVMFFINSTVFVPYYDSATPFRQVFLPFYWILMLLCGLAAGVVGLAAMTRQHERSWLVWLTILTLAWVIFMLLGEFLVPLIFPELAH